MPPMMPPGAVGRPQRTLEEILADKDRAPGNLAVRDVKQEGKDLAGHSSPPSSGPHPRESKAGNLPRERPAIGQSQAASSENFGAQFHEMKKQLVQGDGESRKDFKKRIHASLRAVKKGGQPITTEEQPRRQPVQSKASAYTPPPRSGPRIASEGNEREGPTRAELAARDKVDVPKEGVLKAGFIETARLAARKEDWERLS